MYIYRCIPSGTLTQLRKVTKFSWVNQLFLWSCSIANWLVYQRLHSSCLRGCGSSPIAPWEESGDHGLQFWPNSPDFGWQKKQKTQDSKHKLAAVELAQHVFLGHVREHGRMLNVTNIILYHIMLYDIIYILPPVRSNSPVLLHLPNRAAQRPFKPLRSRALRRS